VLSSPKSTHKTNLRPSNTSTQLQPVSGFSK
jgi:hypothetical protein